MTARKASAPPSPSPEALNTAFAAGMPRRAAAAAIDLDASTTEATGFTQVCTCGLSWFHEGRCARCAARNGNLVCGKVNNHRGRHQAIVLWL